MDILIRDLDENTVGVLKQQAASEGISLVALTRRTLDHAARQIRRRAIFADVEADLADNGGIADDDLSAAADATRGRPPGDSIRVSLSQRSSADASTITVARDYSGQIGDDARPVQRP